MKNTIILIALLMSTKMQADIVSWQIWTNTSNGGNLPSEFTIEIIQNGNTIFLQNVNNNQFQQIISDVEDGCAIITLTAATAFPQDAYISVEQDKEPANSGNMYFAIYPTSASGMGTNTLAYNYCTDQYCNANFSSTVLDNNGLVQFEQQSLYGGGWYWNPPVIEWSLSDGTTSQNASLLHNFNSNNAQQACIAIHQTSVNGLVNCQSTYCQDIVIEEETCPDETTVDMIIEIQFPDSANTSYSEFYFNFINQADQSFTISKSVNVSGANATYQLRNCLADGCYNIGTDSSLPDGTIVSVTIEGGPETTTVMFGNPQEVYPFAGVCINQTTAGNTDIESEQTLSIFPNPASDMLNINLKAGSFAQIKITDLNGKIVWEKTGLNSNLSQIDISQLTNGIYTIQIIEKNEFQTARLLVQH
jgi:hypothetical protein